MLNIFLSTRHLWPQIVELLGMLKVRQQQISDSQAKILEKNPPGKSTSMGSAWGKGEETDPRNTDRPEEHGSPLSPWERAPAH